MARNTVKKAAVLLCFAILFTGCQRKRTSRKERSIRLATTTSLENSGLLDVLLPEFQRKTGIEVQVIPMGTGKALRTARDGNCDVVLVHAPKAEAEFVTQGWGADRRRIMFNHFVIAGPGIDPAEVKGARTAEEAFRRIKATQSTFVSRGDNSGTHKKEMEIWGLVGVAPSGRWYRSVGKGMGETLTMANEMRAYLLIDYGTFIKFRNKIELVALFEDGDTLFNPYGIIAVSPDRHPHVKHTAVLEFMEFLTSQDGRRLIRDFTVEGEVLFHPWPEDKARAF